MNNLTKKEIRVVQALHRIGVPATTTHIGEVADLSFSRTRDTLINLANKRIVIPYQRGRRTYWRPNF